MKQLKCLLFVSLLAGLRLSLEEVQCHELNEGGYTKSFYHNTSSGKRDLMIFIANISIRVLKPFRNASRWCNSTGPGSSLIIINSIKSQKTVNIFIGRQVLANETIVMDAQNILASVRLERSSVNGHKTVPTDVGTNEVQDRACEESKLRQPLAYCVGHVNPQYRYICEYAGPANTYAPWEVSQHNESSAKPCICISPQCWRKNNVGEVEYGREWWSCNCKQDYNIVCRKEVADTEEMSPSTPADFTSSPPGITGASDSTSSMATEPSNPESDTQTPVLASPSTEITEDTALTSPLTQDHTYRASDDKTTVFTSLSLSLSSAAAPAAPAASEPSTENERNETLFIIPLLVAVAFIVVAVILIIRKRKYARRYETSPLNRTDQNEAVPRGYEIMVRDNRPSGDNIYTELEVTQQPTPSSNTTYASIQPTSEVVDMGKSVDYVDIDFPKKDQQKPKSADKGTVSVSPIYSQPFEPTTSDSNTDYVEPFKPDERPTATAPVQSHNAAADQQNVYSLAKAIPLVDPNVIYSEPNKPKKSSTPAGKEVKLQILFT